MNGALAVHPVGEKLPNPLGLYDMTGNVWEQGPPSTEIGWKVIRGGGYDQSESDCRSARRYFYGNHPALNDSNLGFRVVLATDA